MMFADHHYHLSRVLAACSLLALSACASNQALKSQLAVSQESIEQAKTAGAQETAPADFNAASDKLNAAANTKDDVVAMRLAEQAQADANLAHAKTASAQAMTAATELVKSNQALREQISRAK